MNFEKIKSLSEENFEYALWARRKIHENPELGNAETETTKFLVSELEKFGAIVFRPLETGVVALIKGQSDECIALRADIDALPISEETNLPYSSKNKNVMHACGHDIHTAVLLTVGKILLENKSELKKSIKLIFQPDEEGNGGAKRLLEKGVFENPKVSEVFGMHIRPEIESGKIAVKFGKSYAASDMFSIIVHGKSCHGAEPKNGANALLGASAIVSQINKFAPCGIDSETNSVCSVCTFQSGTAGNIIPDEAKISGILRTFGQSDRMLERKKLKETLSAAKDFSCDARLDLIESYPGVVNSELQTQKVFEISKKLFGRCIVLENPTYTTEDFGYYLFEAPGTFFHLGVGSDCPLHNSKLNPNEDAMKNAISVFLAIAVS